MDAHEIQILVVLPNETVRQNVCFEKGTACLFPSTTAQKCRLFGAVESKASYCLKN